MLLATKSINRTDFDTVLPEIHFKQMARYFASFLSYVFKIPVAPKARGKH